MGTKAVRGQRGRARGHPFRRQLARAAKAVLFLLGIYGLIRQLRPNPSPAILRFHSVADKESRWYVSSGITVSPRVFERQVRYLSRRYRITDMDQVCESLVSRKPLPPNSVALTFDDGYQDNFAAAMTLRRYGCTATFFLVADRLQGRPPLWLCEVRRRLLHSGLRRFRLAWNGHVLDYPLQTAAEREVSVAMLTSWVKTLSVASREDFLRLLTDALPVESAGGVAGPVMLSWDQVRVMRQAGMLIGGHTLTHANLVHATEEEVRSEIRGCQEVLARKLGEPPRHFAYPNGGADAYHDERAKAEVRAAGFKTAGTSRFGFVEPGSDPLELPRVGVPASLAELVHALEWWKLKGIGRQVRSPRQART